MADLSQRKFSFRMTDAEKQAAAEWYTAQFRKIAETVQHGAYAMLVLDELLSCITCGFLPEQLVLDFLENRPEALEVVITGRDPSAALLERADYVTEMTLGNIPMKRASPHEKESNTSPKNGKAVCAYNAYRFWFPISVPAAKQAIMLLCVPLLPEKRRSLPSAVP
ncbi:MAG: cob(I)yrinic acid a,c-diamide adenosyltransferase [Ruminococcus sp.]